MVGCRSGDETITRNEAIQQIREELPVTRDEAGNMIDYICGEFEEGWGGGTITNGLPLRYDMQETFAHVILLAAQSECPENIVDAKNWQEANGWD